MWSVTLMTLVLKITLTDKRVFMRVIGRMTLMTLVFILYKSFIIYISLSTDDTFGDILA